MLVSALQPLPAQLRQVRATAAGRALSLAAPAALAVRCYTARFFSLVIFIASTHTPGIETAVPTAGPGG